MKTMKTIKRKNRQKNTRRLKYKNKDKHIARTQRVIKGRFTRRQHGGAFSKFIGSDENRGYVIRKEGTKVGLTGGMQVEVEKPDESNRSTWKWLIGRTDKTAAELYKSDPNYTSLIQQMARLKITPSWRDETSKKGLILTNDDF